MTQAQPEKRPVEQEENHSGYESFKPSPLPDERLAEIRARSTKRYDAYGSDTRWLLRYVDMLRKDNEQLRTRRTSFEHLVFTAVTILVGIGMVGAIAYNIYVQPTQELFPGCTFETPSSCGTWIWDNYIHLVRHPH